MGDTIMVHRSDLGKIFDVLEAAYRHHSARDASNAALHLARETRLSPLTSEMASALDRLKAILETPAPEEQQEEANG